MHAWPLIYSTALITIGAIVIGTGFALLSAMFIVEFAPPALQSARAGRPSARRRPLGDLRPDRHPRHRPLRRQPLDQPGRQGLRGGGDRLCGASVGVGILILTVMITPIMIAIVVDALRAVPLGWREGSVSLGVNRWRALWTVTVRAARPAIVAAAVLATARALGEAIMLSMVTGSVGFAPNPLDGIIFFVDPPAPSPPPSSITPKASRCPRSSTPSTPLRPFCSSRPHSFPSGAGISGVVCAATRSHRYEHPRIRERKDVEPRRAKAPAAAEDAPAAAPAP